MYTLPLTMLTLIPATSTKPLFPCVKAQGCVQGRCSDPELYSLSHRIDLKFNYVLFHGRKQGSVKKAHTQTRLSQLRRGFCQRRRLTPGFAMSLRQEKCKRYKLELADEGTSTVRGQKDRTSKPRPGSVCAHAGVRSRSKPHVSIIIVFVYPPPPSSSESSKNWQYTLLN